MISAHSPVLSTETTLHVEEIDFRNDPRWEAFVSAHPHASIYHHPAWLEALEREYGQKGLYLGCEDGAGQVLAILPLMYTRGLPLNRGGALTGRRLSSLPRTPLAGPLSVHPQATTVVIQEAVRRVSGSHGIQLQIKMQAPELDGLIEGFACTPWRLSYVLRLTEPSAEGFRVADSGHRNSIKRAVNKAIRLGVRVRQAETLMDLRAWYMLYLETMRRNFVPARTYRFFTSLWELLRPLGMMQLLLAEQQRRIIAGSILLRYGRTVSYAFNGSSSADLPMRPNDIIFSEAIDQACKSGFLNFDFGEVDDDRPDLARYKSKWGSEPVRLYRYHYPALHHQECVFSAAQQNSTPLIHSVWRHLPLRVTAFLGDRIYSYL